MKKEIHPQYFTNTTVTCACGRTFTTGSTLATIRIELCSQCHPFYTGKQKLVDTARRVEKFQSRASKQEEVGKTRKGKKVKRAKKAALRQAQGEQAEAKAAEAAEVETAEKQVETQS